MKNIILIGLLIVSMSLISCKKSHTCNCTTNTVVTTSIPGFPKGTFTLPSQTTSKAYSEKMTSGQATAACDHEKATLESTEKAAFDDAFKQYIAYIQYSYSTRCTLE